jgi:hypothetical protein
MSSSPSQKKYLRFVDVSDSFLSMYVASEIENTKVIIRRPKYELIRTLALIPIVRGP